MILDFAYPTATRKLAHLDVLGQESVEEVDVGGPEVHQVLEFLDRGGLHGEQTEAWSKESA